VILGLRTSGAIRAAAGTTTCAQFLVPPEFTQMPCHAPSMIDTDYLSLSDAANQAVAHWARCIHDNLPKKS